MTHSCSLYKKNSKNNEPFLSSSENTCFIPCGNYVNSTLDEAESLHPRAGSGLSHPRRGTR
jgi:hypothetical protein